MYGVQNCQVCPTHLTHLHSKSRVPESTTWRQRVVYLLLTIAAATRCEIAILTFATYISTCPLSAISTARTMTEEPVIFLKLPTDSNSAQTAPLDEPYTKTTFLTPHCHAMPRDPSQPPRTAPVKGPTEPHTNQRAIGGGCHGAPLPSAYHGAETLGLQGWQARTDGPCGTATREETRTWHPPRAQSVTRARQSASRRARRRRSARRKRSTASVRASAPYTTPSAGSRGCGASAGSTTTASATPS